MMSSNSTSSEIAKLQLQKKQAQDETTMGSSRISREKKKKDNNNNGNGNGDIDNNNSDHDNYSDQLSADLALFLANPSLRNALADGSLDLKSYSETVQEELCTLETQCIQVYKDNTENIRCLKTDLQTCETVLSKLHEMLLGFQADLGGLSVDIRQLQTRSRSLDIQLRNRRAAESQLRHYLQHIVLAPNIAQAILAGPVNMTFLDAVKEVQCLYKNCNTTSGTDWSCELPVTETAAGQEMKEQLEILRKLAMKRSRDYLLQQMALLRKPQTNVRLLQVHGLLKYAYLQDFLEEASPNLIAPEIFHVYCESMSQTLQSLFRTYSQQLLQVDSTKHVSYLDVIVVDEATLQNRKAIKQSSSSHSHHAARDIFCLGNRQDQALSNGTIAAHVAVLQKEEYHYEVLFRSILQHLVDAVTNEHVFCRQFFKRDAFDKLFTGTLSILTEQLENYLFTCYDAVCLLLMVSVAHRFKNLTKSRRIRSLDSFLDSIPRLIWPRLKTVMDLHLRSIAGADAAGLGNIDLHAHYVSRRFGEFCASLLLILHKRATPSLASSPSSSAASTASRNKAPNKTLTPALSSTGTTTEASPMSAGSKLLEDIMEMMDAFILLLERLSEKHTSQKEKTVFLINNLDMIVCIFQERKVASCKETTKFVERLIRARDVFVEEELLGSFSKMIAFVQQSEQHIKNNAESISNVNETVVESLVLDFASSWKSSIDQINRNVLSYFSNFRNGMEILKHCLTQLLLYYTRFQDIIRKVYRGRPTPAFCKDLVSTNVILNEIKKYALAI